MARNEVASAEQIAIPARFPIKSVSLVIWVELREMPRVCISYACRIGLNQILALQAHPEEDIPIMNLVDRDAGTQKNQQVRATTD